MLGAKVEGSVMYSPDIYKASEVVGRKLNVDGSVDRPFCIRRLSMKEVVRRTKMAFGVLSGKYDALDWGQ